MVARLLKNMEYTVDTTCASQINKIFSYKRAIIEGKVLQVYFSQIDGNELDRLNKLLDVVVTSFNGTILKKRPSSPGSKRQDYDIQFESLEQSKSFTEYIQKTFKSLKPHTKIVNESGSFEEKVPLDTFDRGLRKLINENCINPNPSSTLISYSINNTIVLYH